MARAVSISRFSHERLTLLLLPSRGDGMEQRPPRPAVESSAGRRVERVHCLDTAAFELHPNNIDRVFDTHSSPLLEDPLRRCLECLGVP